MQAKNLQKHLKKIHGENCTVHKFYCIVFAKPLHCRGSTNTACTFAIFKLVFHYLIFVMVAFCNHTVIIPVQKSIPLRTISCKRWFDPVLTVLMCGGKQRKEAVFASKKLNRYLKNAHSENHTCCF